jgi:7-cyano-7-deazaguanine synthase
MESIVLLSGGQDSTTCLAWAKETLGAGVRAVAFDYGQRHRVELEQAAKIADRIGVLSFTILDAGVLKQLGGTALTDDRVAVESVAGSNSHNEHARAHGLPSTFVPGRNMLFLTIAAAFGAKFGVYNLVTGVCQQDRAGYPDCREEFILRAQGALSYALEEEVTINIPLIDKSKGETWQLAADLGILNVIIEDTHTCYHGDRSERHPWGYGCGDCPACVERSKGYVEFITAGTGAQA